MNSTELTQRGAQAAAPALLASGDPEHDGLPGLTVPSDILVPRASGYGLPCAKCRTYYSAALAACPVCKNTERVSPMLQATTVTVPPAPEPEPDLEMLEQERERFLQEFKAQIAAGDLQINATSSFRCMKEENHEGSFEPAAVCQGCYDHLRERADQFEAALLIDANDAAQIIYEAVWSDPSDPGKTYQNAAQALLNELRKRAGISSVLGSLQPLRH
jgi:hypothetical protein